MNELVSLIPLLAGLTFSALLFWEVRKILLKKEKIERERKEILREFLKLKKSSKPSTFVCFSCKKTLPLPFGRVALRFDDRGRVEKYEVLCLSCLEKEGKDGIELERYAGKLEKFYKEAIYPFFVSEKAFPSLLKTFKTIYRVKEDKDA